jgi:crotonobetainyl-CoA:carnitine CoA-transferase CaiB-like acyl-CoA transferase
MSASASATSTGPLAGLVVVDASWGMPAGIASLLLSDYGATVIKLERPGGGPQGHDVMRGVLDRGKWSVEADLTTDAGRATARTLLAGADVWLESFGAGRAGELGLGYDELHAEFPRLVQVSYTGYGQTGPWRDRPGFDALVAARCGLMAEQGGHRDGPIFLGHPSIAYCTGFLSTIGILAALRARHITGRGQQVDASLLDGMLSIMSMNWWWNERDLGYLARTGTETGFGHNRLITDLFICQDGQYLMVHTGGDGGFKRLTDILGVGENIRTIEGVEMTVPLDEEEYRIARHVVPDAFLARPRDEWIKLFQEADVAALPVLRAADTLQEPQVQYADLVIDVDDAVHGRMHQVGPVIRFAETPAGLPAPAPTVGQHNAILAAGQVPASTLTDTLLGGADDRPNGPLDGLRVIDFSAFFATAYGARLLSDLGADVIKVEPVRGDHMRPLPDLFEGAQRGKRTIALDMRTPEGQEVARRLVASADVVMHNFRPGKAEKIGLGYEQLKAIKPDLIYAFLPGFGSSGPMEKLKSFAPLVSGYAGLLYEGAGVGNPPVRRVLGNEDLYNGLAGAVAILMAVQHRNRTGMGQYLENPQLHSSLFVVGEHATDANGGALLAHELDADQTGWSPLYRLYRTNDGWICLACVGDAAFGRLAEALAQPALATDPRFATNADRAANSGALAELLTAAFATLTSVQAQTALDEHRVPAETPLDYPLMPEFLWEEWAVDEQRVFEHHHAEHGWIREVGMVVRLSDTPGLNKGTSPRLGQHSAEILGELGYDDSERTALLAGTVRAAAEDAAEDAADDVAVDATDAG